MSEQPIMIRQGLALWYSPDDDGYYWQDDGGWGDRTSQLFISTAAAIDALERGRVQLDPIGSIAAWER